LDWEGDPGESAIVTTSLTKLSNGHVYQANFGGDTLLGSAGNDSFYARPGVDFFDGGARFDTAVFSGSPAVKTKMP